ncbi:MAG TPA: ACT domain-containing protein, partial [Oscillospiraceae bacterium]|nr:ACT domain-containing protein [Oscillospiraceae bacterium]
AYYKYKDAVRPFNDMMTGRIVTFQYLLKDEPGVLSSLLTQFAASGANILTINQSIPTNGCAAVTITAETGGMKLEIEELLRVLREMRGVLRCEILAG